MIIQFKCRETRKIWEGSRALCFPYEIQHVARRKLRMLNNAKQLNDLRLPPGNCLEALEGKREGEFSIRINRQWRVCFKWLSGNVYEVGIEGYH